MVRYSFLWFLLFFLLLFLPFPLSNSLTGSTDTWWYLSVFHELENNIDSFFSGIDWGSSLYPQTGLFRFGEPAFGSGILYLILKFFISDVIWTWWVFISILFASNAYGMILLSRFFIRNPFARVFSALVFSSSVFMLGLIDDPKVITWFPALLCLFLLLSYSESGRISHLLLSGFSGGFSVWFSSYNFFFLSLILVFIFLFYERAVFLRSHFKNLGIYLLPAYILPVIPFILIYFPGPAASGAYNPIDLMQDAGALSLQFADFFKSLPGNLLYSSGWDKNPSYVYPWHCLNVGVVFWLLTVVGVWTSRENRKLLLLLILFGTLFSLGPWIFADDKKLPSLFYFFFQSVGFIRIPIRAFLISLIGLSLLAGQGCEKWFESGRFGKWISLGLGIIFLLENVPVQFQKYSSRDFLNPPEGYLEFFQSRKGETVVHFPCGYEDFQFSPRLSIPAREQMYEYWQTQSGVRLMNGTGYLPASRMELQAVANQCKNSNELSQFLAKYKVHFVVLFPDLILPGECERFEPLLDSIGNAKKVMNQKNIVIWELVY